MQVSLDRSAAASWPPLPASPPPAPAPPLQLLLLEPLPPPLPPPWPSPAPPLPLPTPPSSLRSLPLRPRGASPAWGHPVVPAVCRAESAGDPLRHRSACAECACLLRLLIRHRAAAAAGQASSSLKVRWGPPAGIRPAVAGEAAGVGHRASRAGAPSHSCGLPANSCSFAPNAAPPHAVSPTARQLGTGRRTAAAPLACRRYPTHVISICGLRYLSGSANINAQRLLGFGARFNIPPACRHVTSVAHRTASAGCTPHRIRPIHTTALQQGTPLVESVE